jgi:chromosome segregation ATPase
MQKRDEAIKRAHEDFVSAKRQLRGKQEVLTEREAFLSTEQKNNSEVELKIAGFERTIAKKRELLTHATHKLDEMADQVEVTRRASQPPRSQPPRSQSPRCPTDGAAGACSTSSATFTYDLGDFD